MTTFMYKENEYFLKITKFYSYYHGFERRRRYEFNNYLALPLKQKEKEKIKKKLSYAHFQS